MNYTPSNAGTRIPESLLINKSAISRITSIPVNQIIQIKTSRINGKVVVLLKDGEVVLTIKELKDEFHRYRREAGSKLKARRISENLWNVNDYRIEVLGKRYKCECKDHQNHGNYCKHIWAVILEQEARKEQN
jgi:hypothetical protein